MHVGDLDVSAVDDKMIAEHAIGNELASVYGTGVVHHEIAIWIRGVCKIYSSAVELKIVEIRHPRADIQFACLLRLTVHSHLARFVIFIHCPKSVAFRILTADRVLCKAQRLAVGNDQLDFASAANAAVQINIAVYDVPAFGEEQLIIGIIYPSRIFGLFGPSFVDIGRLDRRHIDCFYGHIKIIDASDVARFKETPVIVTPAYEFIAVGNVSTLGSDIFGELRSAYLLSDLSVVVLLYIGCCEHRSGGMAHGTDIIIVPDMRFFLSNRRSANGAILAVVRVSLVDVAPFRLGMRAGINIGVVVFFRCFRMIC